MSNMMFCNDATEVFLEKESVDLFFTHPPYFITDRLVYGGKFGKQIQNRKTPEEYYNLYIKAIRHMEYALKDTGSIFIILNNSSSSFALISEIYNNTDLVIDKQFVWNYINSYFVKEVVGNEFNIILHLHKGNPYINKEYEIKDFVISMPWEPSTSLSKYEHLGFVFDSFPEGLADIIINKFSKPGDTVGDIFGGTGTTCFVAKNLNRNYVYNDVSEQQYNIAMERLNG
jgi:DNA modification methylase